MPDLEYAEYQRHHSVLADFYCDQQLYAIVELNLADLERTLQSHLDAYAREHFGDTPRMQMILLDVNRALLNYLGAVRTFLDHTRTRVVRRCGEASAALDSFEAGCRQEFDTQFAYRFAYRLRNYAQHCGMPAGAMKLGAGWSDPTRTAVTYHLTVSFERDFLLANFDGWGPVKADLAAMPAQFEVVPPMRNLLACLWRINAATLQDQRVPIEESAHFVRDLIAELGLPDAFPTIMATEDFGPKMKIHAEYLPLHILSLTDRTFIAPISPC